MFFTLLLIFNLISASNSSEFPNSRFDGTRAFETLVFLSTQGNRFYNAPDREESCNQLVKLLESEGLSVTKQNFQAALPNESNYYDLTNIIATQTGDHPVRVVLASHWDTRPWAENASQRRAKNKPIQGANDGTSGLAVIIEILRTLNEKPLQNIAVDVIFFDGEELGKPKVGGYCQGSRYFVKNQDIYPHSMDYVVVLDMVGDKSIRLEQEVLSMQSSPQLWAVLERHFKTQGIPFNPSPMAIKDDQAAFTEIGVPAALIIDFDYPHWHTPEDTMDKCSPESLEKVGTALVNWLREIDANYKSKP